MSLSDMQKLRMRPVEEAYPYVEFDAIKYRLKRPEERKPGESEFEEVKERSKFNVGGNTNARPEVIDYYRDKGWMVVGWGNLNPKNEAHVALEKYLKRMMAERGYEAEPEAPKKGRKSGGQES